MNATLMQRTPATTIAPDIAKRLVSPAAYEEWKHLEADFAQLRKEMPFARAVVDGYDPFWVATKYADVREISLNPAIFRTNGYRSMLSSKAQLEFFDSPAAPKFRALVMMDPPEHSAARRLTFKEFAPNGVRALESDIRVIANETIEELLSTGGRCDFVTAAALRYPLRVILSLLGLPRSDEEFMLKLTQELFNPQDPDLNATGADVDVNDAQAFDVSLLQKFTAYFDAITDDRRANPRDDVTSKIANGVINGEPISYWDAMSQYIAIVTAGHDTTSSSTAGGVWALAERPDLYARIGKSADLIMKLVDESVRWTSPIRSFMRTAVDDYELRGQHIRKGDWIMLSYPSANRDEDIFDSPDEFSVDRPRNTTHVAFGYGPHICLGQHLARLEMGIFFDELFKRVASIELDGQPTRTRSAFVSSVKTLPLRFTTK